MAGIAALIGGALAWLEPAGIQEWRRSALQRYAESAAIARFAQNASLRNRHIGERCFILCSGPSVKLQDLRPLAGELVISVASAYQHPDFDLIRPRYHCVPRISRKILTDAEIVKWFMEIDDRLDRGTEMILSYREREAVQSSNVFANREVAYLFTKGDEYPTGERACDLTARIPHTQSVSIMAICLAIYLGCSEIYLLGTDHDQFLTGTYKHFYDQSINDGKDPFLAEGDALAEPRYQQFEVLAKLWQQYRWLKGVAAERGVRIVNASAGGELDEFERVDLASLFQESHRDSVRLEQTNQR